MNTNIDEFMPDIKIDIEPFTVTTTNVMTKMSIRRITINLNTSANIMVDLFDDNNRFIQMKILTLAGEDYSNWGTDDNYIIEWVKQNLN